MFLQKPFWSQGMPFCPTILVVCVLVHFSLNELAYFFAIVFSTIYYLIKTGHSVSFGPAVSHLLCAGFTEIWNTVKHLIQARYEILSKEESAVGGSNNGNDEQTMNNFLVKDLEAALDSFDNLFCRRCLVRTTHPFRLCCFAPFSHS